MNASLQRLQRALDGRYRIERELGHGGTAVVYLATDLRQPRTVALKVLRPELASLLGPGRFLREIEISAQLNHPNILPLFDAGDAEGLPWFVMPYITGESLRQRLEREQQLSVPEALQITREVGEALRYAHAQGIVHRDIKPENILLSHGHALVSDFGIARAISTADQQRMTETGMAIGTVEYMSPEQATGQGTVDGRSDQYSLACVLYEMLVGGPPFVAPTSQAVLARQLVDPVPPIRTVRPSVPVPIEAAVLAALAKSKADRFPTIEAFIEGLEGKRASPAQPYPAAQMPRRVPWKPWLLAGAVIAVLTVGALLLRGRLTGSAPLTLNPDLVVVAPFEVLDREYQVWAEGMTTLISGSLDGAGPIRAVPPSTAAQLWSGGRADRASSSTLARRAGAGLAIYGLLVSAGADSVRLTATLLDVAEGATTEFEIREQGARIDRGADSLSARIMRELGRTRPLAAVRSAGLGSTSAPALKAYLAGEQYYRRHQLDSAEFAYRRALEIDSNFALAWRRRALVRRQRAPESDDTISIWALRAGSLNRGLPIRDSLMVLSDSLYMSLDQDQADSLSGDRTRRLYATLEEVTRRYPDDPEGWYLLGRAGFYTPRLGTDWSQTLAAMNRAIALDSGFVPAALGMDATWIAFRLGDRQEAYRHLSLAARNNAVWDQDQQGLQFAAAMLADPGTMLRRLDRWMDTASTDAITSALGALSPWADSAQVAVRLARTLLARAGAFDSSEAGANRRGAANLALLFRGHLTESFRHLGRFRWPPLVAAMALYGGVPPESAARIFDPNGPRGPGGIPLLSRQRDTTGLRELIRRLDSAGRAAATPGARRTSIWTAARARAHLLVARGDTAQAISRLIAVIDSTCWGCSYSAHLHDIHALAPLLWAGGRDQEAERYLDWYTPIVPVVVLDVALTLQRARVEERLGNREKAIAAYRRFARAWAYGDPQLQPMVEEARAALRRLGAGGVWQEP